MPDYRVFPVWRGTGVAGGGGNGDDGGWSAAWSRCLRWEHDGPDRSRIPVFDYLAWLVLSRRVCQRGRGAVGLSADMLSIKLPQLFHSHQIPKVFREDSIISGYRRPHSSALDCVLSSFQLTNETLNIWTHFLPTWYFLWRLCALCSSMNVLSDSYTWPLLIYMLLICVYPFTSSCAHTFSSMSPESRHVCYFFDYGALSLYSLGCAISYSYYVMPDPWINTWLHQHFVPFAVGNSVFCTSLSCYSRFLELQSAKRSKALRTAAFVLPFVFDTVPLFYRLLLCCGGGTMSSSDALYSHCYHLLFAFLTCFLFTAHLPERLYPGRFDYFGHSHQLFHVSAVVGTHFQMEGVLADMLSRKAWLLAQQGAPSLLGTLGALLLGLILNLGIIGVFSAALMWTSYHSARSQR
ncbi:membrane progestin receptor delta-like isoform X2 [Gouania willdenowi]|uniref:Membrane progestin receptor delta-like n=1 Tax=Gouania willdenowi TaxID=441366 RepID=A0A8C5E629_GOUWI|nr:membrane progestin receptor delta-like isoform X2 [Gouania willdenowi]